MSEWTEEQHADARALVQGAGRRGWALKGALDEIERLKCVKTERDLWIKQTDHARAQRDELQSELDTARNSWNFDEGKKVCAERDKLRAENERIWAERNEALAEFDHEAAGARKLRAELGAAETQRDDSLEHIAGLQGKLAAAIEEAAHAYCCRDELQAQLSEERSKNFDEKWHRQRANLRTHLKEATAILQAFRANAKKAGEWQRDTRYLDYPGMEEEGPDTRIPLHGDGPKLHIKHHDIAKLEEAEEMRCGTCGAEWEDSVTGPGTQFHACSREKPYSMERG